jgi:hypothetical protein
MPSQWSEERRGRFLRLLFQCRGIDPDRLFSFQYFPTRSCWLLTQTPDHPSEPRRAAASAYETDLASFYLQTMAELRRTALATLTTASAAPNWLWARRKYQLPEQPQEMTVADLVNLVGEIDQSPVQVQFDAEGGWRADNSAK